MTSIRVCLVSWLSPGMPVGWHRWPSIWLTIVTHTDHISCVWDAIWVPSGGLSGSCLSGMAVLEGIWSCSGVMPAAWVPVWCQNWSNLVKLDHKCRFW